MKIKLVIDNDRKIRVLKDALEREINHLENKRCRSCTSMVYDYHDTLLKEANALLKDVKNQKDIMKAKKVILRRKEK